MKVGKRLGDMSSSARDPQVLTKLRNSNKSRSCETICAAG